MVDGLSGQNGHHVPRLVELKIKPKQENVKIHYLLMVAITAVTQTQRLKPDLVN